VTNATEAAISEEGRIVISATNSMYFLNASTYTAVVVPGAGSADNAVNVGGINDFGDVVGYFYTNSGTSPSFFRDREGEYQAIDVPGSSYTQAAGLNNLDQAVGVFYDGVQYHGFLWTNGSFTTLDYPAAVSTFARGSTTLARLSDSITTRAIMHGFIALPTP
jgi:hypothetical protein